MYETPILQYVNNVCMYHHLNSCFRSVAVGAKTGYKLFSISSVDKLEQIYESGKSIKEDRGL